MYLPNVFPNFKKSLNLTLKYSKGFTLIELLVVIAILGILAAALIVLINPGKRINQSKDSTSRTDMASIVTAIGTFYADAAQQGLSSYPASVPATAQTQLTTATTINSQGSIGPEIKAYPNCSATTGCSYTLQTSKTAVAVSGTAVACDPTGATACAAVAISGPAIQDYSSYTCKDTNATCTSGAFWCYLGNSLTVAAGKVVPGGTISPVQTAGDCVPQ